MESLSALQALIDVYQTLVKLLGRAAVQAQLAVALGAVLGAWYMAKPLVRLAGRAYASLRGRQRRRAVRLGRDVEESLSGWGMWLIRILFQVADQAMFPLVAIMLLSIARGLFLWQGWFAGLLDDTIQVLWLLAIYRVALGLLYALGNKDLVKRIHTRLFAPAITLLLVLLVLNNLVRLTALGQAPLFPGVENSVTLNGLFLATVGFYFWFAASGAIKELLQNILSRRRNANPGSIQASLTLLQYAFIAVGLIAVFGVLRLDGTTIAAVTGGLSIGVGLALQDVIKNFLGGIILLFEGSVRPGDWVEIAGTEGEVDKLSIRSTTVRTFDNVEYIVPNQDWLSATVTTYTRTSRRVRTRVAIGVGYNSDVRQVQQLLIDTAKAHPEVLDEPEPIAPLIGFGDSSVDFVLLAWVSDAKNKGKVAVELRFMIWDAFKAHDIEIPFPQRDLHIRSGLPSPVALSEDG